MCLFHDHSVTVEHFSYSVLTTHKVFVTSNNVEKIITTLFDSDAHLEDLTSSGLCYTAFFTSFYTAFTHFGEIVRKFLFTPYILDCIFFFLQHCIPDCLHGRERFAKLTSHSVLQELPTFHGAEVFIIIFKKIIGL
jgi:hypothetical protein